jgi:hypothetical protein
MQASCVSAVVQRTGVQYEVWSHFGHVLPAPHPDAHRCPWHVRAGLRHAYLPRLAAPGAGTVALSQGHRWPVPVSQQAPLM